MTNTAATYAEMTNPASWAMTVKRQETKGGNVSYLHTVFFKGEIYDTRKSKRQYAGHWMEVAKGGRTRNLKDSIEVIGHWIKDHDAKAAQGGTSHVSADEYRALAAELQGRLDRTRATLEEAEAEGPEYDWRIIDGGYTSRPDLMKGNAQALAK